jgi:hypothetical protein
MQTHNFKNMQQLPLTIFIKLVTIRVESSAWQRPTVLNQVALSPKYDYTATQPEDRSVLSHSCQILGTNKLISYRMLLFEKLIVT